MSLPTCVFRDPFGPYCGLNESPLGVTLQHGHHKTQQMGHCLDTLNRNSDITTCLDLFCTWLGIVCCSSYSLSGQVLAAGGAASAAVVVIICYRNEIACHRVE
eukprot:5976032-Amphidinium_carterae.1